MTVSGMVTKIDPPRKGADGYDYWLTTFKLGNGRSAISYICPEMRNHRHWIPVLQLGAGTLLEGLALMKDGKTIDADFRPRVVPTTRQGELF
jgi:hypothetical protein